MTRRSLSFIALLCASVPLWSDSSSHAWAQDRPETPPWTEEAPERVAPKHHWKPKLEVAWNRYLHIDEMDALLRRLAETWPELISLSVIGKSVETVEGLQQGNDLHPLQETFADLGAAQCGYCTPGILMVAEALLEKESEPDDEQIAEALSGNICRCTGYNRIIEAVKWAAAKKRGDDWRPDEELFMGHEVPQ